MLLILTLELELLLLLLSIFFVVPFLIKMINKEEIDFFNYYILLEPMHALIAQFHVNVLIVYVDN